MLYGRKWIVLTTLAASVAAGVLVSCQHRSPSPEPSAAVRAPAPEAPAAAVPSAAVVTSAAPAAPVIDWRKLGFTFPAAPDRQHTRSAEDTDAHDASCVACHATQGPDAHTMHGATTSLASGGLSCIDCHGGNWNVKVPAGIQKSDPSYNALKLATHVAPKHPELWRDEHGNPTSANPQITATGSIMESPDYIRFINPGDLRAARVSCASCHEKQTNNVPTSMMAHGAMLWGAALYNNGAINRKNPLYGEAYGPTGSPAALEAVGPVTAGERMRRGILNELYPLPRWEITQPGNVLRVFERGGRFRPVLGIPEPGEDPGRPDVKLSDRGFGTDVRTDPVFIGLQKTRLFDPTLNMLGTNDHPGDYRSSGCSACHVVYANDRNPVHSAYWANYGNRGESFNTDRTVNPSSTTQPYDKPQDPSRANREAGHPVQHVFVKSMPTSTCIVCHVHPGTNVLNSYLGYMWWDNESDGQAMYPKKQRYPTTDDEYRASQHNPEGAAVRGLWSDLYPDALDHNGNKAGSDFLSKLGTEAFNQGLKHVQFADFHGHGWVFRKVYKQDRVGNMLDAEGKQISFSDPARFNKAVHLKDIHLEKGMHCSDCHFSQDVHGDGNLYGETRNAVMVDCVDCHGTAERPASILSYLNGGANARDYLRTVFTGNTGATPGQSLDQLESRFGDMIHNHFDVRDGRLVQKSLLYEQLKANMQGAAPEEIKAAAAKANLQQSWEVVQVTDTVGDKWKVPGVASSDEATRRGKLALYAHTVRRNGQWGNVSDHHDEKDAAWQVAHSNSKVSCYACHSSWNTSCFGCHLPQRANQRKTMQHNEGALTRNYTTYNYQTLRDDVYMLGKDSTVRGGKVVPIRSACAVVVSSQDANRQWIYEQQQTVSAEGFAGTAFSPNFPHTVRAAETKQCSDCHVSKKGDNNAIVSQLLMQGTNAVNFIGRFAWVAEEDEGLEAVAVTERDEPQAVIGSRLHELAYPDFFKQHQDRAYTLNEAHEHHGTVLDLQLRGEYLYAACGRNGFIAYDVSNIDNKGFSEPIVTAPVSPLGQRFYIPSKYATSICSPSTMAIDPTRPHLPENEEGWLTKIGTKTIPIDPANPVRGVHPLYAFLYLTDREEGLVVIGNPANSPNKPGVSTLLDGNPENNFLERALTYNPGGLLHGARSMTLYGTWAYITCDAGLVVLDMNDPLHPRVIDTPQLAGLKNPKKITFQFRYGFVVDDDGLKVLDVTFPDKPRVVSGAQVNIPDARDIYVCRTYGYIAAGKQGLLIIDLKAPEHPALDQAFDDDGHINDANAVRVGMTNSSLFAYIASGRNGLRIVELTSPDDTPTYMGFSPRPTPRAIASYSTHGPAVALSKGLDRDRAVDESGNQLSVFGRRGSRPFTLEEQQALYLHVGSNGQRTQLYTVDDFPTADPTLKPAGGGGSQNAPASAPAAPAKDPFDN